MVTSCRFAAGATAPFVPIVGTRQGRAPLRWRPLPPPSPPLCHQQRGWCWTAAGPLLLLPCCQPPRLHYHGRHPHPRSCRHHHLPPPPPNRHPCPRRRPRCHRCNLAIRSRPSWCRTAARQLLLLSCCQHPLLRHHHPCHCRENHPTCPHSQHHTTLPCNVVV